jgi:hypothetical protein
MVHLGEDIVDRTRRVGAWTVAAAIFVAIAALFFSNGWSGEGGFWSRFMEVMYIPTIPCDPEPTMWCRAYYPQMEFRYGIPTKYVILACIAATAWGMLLVCRVTRLPSGNGKLQGKFCDALNFSVASIPCGHGPFVHTCHTLREKSHGTVV